MAVDEACIPALHAAALLPGVFQTVTLRRCITSWEELVRADETFDQLVNVVHGVLRYYDLPDLVKMVGTDRVNLVEPVNALKQRVR